MTEAEQEVVEAAREYVAWLDRMGAGERSQVGQIRDRLRSAVAALDAA